MLSADTLGEAPSLVPYADSEMAQRGIATISGAVRNAILLLPRITTPSYYTLPRALPPGHHVKPSRSHLGFVTRFPVNILLVQLVLYIYLVLMPARHFSG